MNGEMGQCSTPHSAFRTPNSVYTPQCFALDPHRPAAHRTRVSCRSAACLVVSLQPAYDDSSLTWDPTLVGTWKTMKTRPRWTSRRPSGTATRWCCTPPHDTFTLTGHLTQVGDRTLLDLMPQAGVDSAALLLPVHAVFRIEHTADGLTIAALDYDQLRQRVLKGDLPNAVIDERKNVVLTGDTSQFRAWLKQPGSNGPAFAEPVHLTRAQAG